MALLLALLTAFPLRAQDPQPFARTRLEPGPRVAVGQKVIVVVEVLVPNWFTAAPWFPSLDIDDAIAIFDKRGTNFTERIDGETWAGQSRSYDIYPQRPGAYSIKNIPIRVRYNSPSQGPRTQVTVSPPPVRFDAAVPAAARGLSYFISTTELEIEQSFDRDPATLRVGEAFRRTVKISVRDALSMVIPPLSPRGEHGGTMLSSDPLPGLAVYPDPPEVRDEGGERGQQIVGRRVERITYVAEREGDYHLDEIELAWWDVDAEEMKISVLPAVEVRVEPNPDLAVEIPLPPDETGVSEGADAKRVRISLLFLLRRWGWPLSALALVLYVLIRLSRRYGPRLYGQWQAAQMRRHDSEAAAFDRFRRATRSGDARSTWRYWIAWLDRIHVEPGNATICDFVAAADDPDLERRADALDIKLFARDRDPPDDWSTVNPERGVAAARKRYRRTPSSKAGSYLALNPIEPP